MKNYYVRRGTTVAHESLHIETLVVNGTLKVSGELTARKITGKGVVICNYVSASSAVVRELHAETVLIKEIAAETLCADTVISDSTAVSGIMKVRYFNGSSLIMTCVSEVEKLKASNVVSVPKKQKNCMRLLIAAFWTRMQLTALNRLNPSSKKKENPERDDQQDMDELFSDEEELMDFIRKYKAAVACGFIADPDHECVSRFSENREIRRAA